MARRTKRLWTDEEKWSICFQTAAAPGLSEGSRFLPVEIVETVKPAFAAPVAENLIEFDLAGWHRMRINGSYDPEALARLMRGLSA